MEDLILLKILDERAPTEWQPNRILMNELLGSSERTSDTLDNFVKNLREYKTIATKAGPNSIARCENLLGSLDQQQIRDFNGKSDTIFSTAFDTCSIALNREKSMELLEKIVTHRTFLPSEKDNKISISLLEKYASESEPSATNWYWLLNHTVSNSFWDASIDGNSFGKRLVSEFISTGHTHKRMKLKEFFDFTIGHETFNPSSETDDILSYMLTKSISVSLTGGDQLSLVMNDWITRCLNLDSFTMSSGNFPETLIKYKLRFKNSAKKLDKNWVDTISKFGAILLGRSRALGSELKLLRVHFQG